MDHSSNQFAVPHIHLQLLFSNQATTPWINCPGGNVQALRAALCNMRISTRVRLHAHDVGTEGQAPNGGKADEQVVKALPRLVLTVGSAARLGSDDDGSDRTCPFCLEPFEAGEEVLFMPCTACHVGHASCTERWLNVASTCPTCRFALPREPSQEELAALVAPAIHELSRIRDGFEPMICQTVDDDEDERSPPPQQQRGAPLSASSASRSHGDDNAAERGLALTLRARGPARQKRSEMAPSTRATPPTPPSPSATIAPAPVPSTRTAPGAAIRTAQPVRRTLRMRQTPLNRLARRLFGRAQ